MVTSTASGDGQALTGLRIVAAVRCAPPANRPLPAERATCRPWLAHDFELAAPSLRSILALGQLVWDATLDTARSVGWQVPRLPGLGEIRWDRFLSALYRVGYDGPVVVEHEDRGFEGSEQGRLGETLVD